MTKNYVGRFAPSPTGPLHFGSLVAAMSSYLEAKSNHGKWLLRIEDLDPPREIAGSADQIITDLESFGFEWDDDIVYQSTHNDLYQDVINTLLEKDLAFYCECSRKELSQQASHSNEIIYPGNCSHKHLAPNKGLAIRLKVPNETIRFIDEIKGPQSQQLKEKVGDFVIKRKDGLFAYQLAVVIDDAEQNITHIMRGEDLLDSTPRQIQIQRYLSLATPQYAHTPLVMGSDNKKFSKSSPGSKPLDISLQTLLDSWHFLKQSKVNTHDFDSTESFWSWVIKNWDIERLR